MSVIIRGIDMPKNCAECPCGDVQDGWCYVHCDALEKLKNGYPDITKRPDLCPLDEVEPEQPTIDAIPVEWLEKKRSYMYPGSEKELIVRRLIDDWREENVS